MWRQRPTRGVHGRAGELIELGCAIVVADKHDDHNHDRRSYRNLNHEHDRGAGHSG